MRAACVWAVVYWCYCVDSQCGVAWWNNRVLSILMSFGILFISTGYSCDTIFVREQSDCSMDPHAAGRHVGQLGKCTICGWSCSEESQSSGNLPIRTFVYSDWLVGHNQINKC